MSQFSVSVFGWLRKNNTAIARVMLSLICLGLVLAKFVVLKEVDFVSLSLLLLAAISYRPTMIAAVLRFLRHIRVGGVDLGLQDPDLEPIQARLAAVKQELASSSVLDAPALAATTPRDISDIVRTKQIVLHDDNCERARLFVGQNGDVGLELCDSSGERRAALFVSTEGVGKISLADEDGLWRLRLNGNNAPLVISDSNDVPKAAFIVDDNSAVLAVMGRTGKVCSIVSAIEDEGRIQVMAMDRNGSAGLMARDGAPGFLHLSDESTGASTSMSAGLPPKFDKGTGSG